MPFRLAAILFATLICLDSVHAEVKIFIGTGYSCLGKAIVNGRGKTTPLATLKNKINPKIDAAKVKLAAAKAKGKAGAAAAATQSAKIKELKATISQGKLCNKGTLTSSVSPMWAAINGTFIGNYDLYIYLVGNKYSLGSGKMQISNTSVGTYANTEFKFVDGVASTVFPDPTSFAFETVGATFPATQIFPGTPLGDLTVTMYEDARVKITTIVPKGTLKDSALEFNGQFVGNTFTGQFTSKFNGELFAEGNFTLTR